MLLWLASRKLHSRHTLFPARKNGKKPDKIIDTDGKLTEDDKTSTSRTIVYVILRSEPAANNPEVALQKIFSIFAVLPSLELGLINADNQTSPCQETTRPSHPTLPLMENIFLPAVLPAHTGTTVAAITLIWMPDGEGCRNNKR